jgi:hypothetical protein
MGDTDKGEGRGRGKFTEKGVQAQQAADLAALKDAVQGLADATADLADRVSALEGPAE